jgi:hypothetical protein
MEFPPAPFSREMSRIVRAFFQEFVGLKSGDLPFDIIFYVNHNSFYNPRAGRT